MMLPPHPTIDRYTNFEGYRVRYWRMGTTGPPLVLLHGIGRSVWDWAPVMPALAHAHRVFAVDLLGCGRSDKPIRVYNAALALRFIAAMLDRFELPSATLMGHSLGGGCCLHAALHYPERVQKLVLVAPAGLARGLSPALRLLTLPGVGEAVFAHITPARVAPILRACYVQTAHEPAGDAEHTAAYFSMPGAREAFLATLREHADLGGVRAEAHHALVDHLHEITHPTLVLWGQQDRILPVAGAAVARARLPNARVEVLQDCGHALYHEYPAFFVRRVTEFLA